MSQECLGLVEVMFKERLVSSIKKNPNMYTYFF